MWPLVTRMLVGSLDERNYKIKRVRNLVLLENVINHGTMVCGSGDRCSHLFWQAEWLEKGEWNTINLTAQSFSW